MVENKIYFTPDGKIDETKTRAVPYSLYDTKKPKRLVDEWEEYAEKTLEEKTYNKVKSFFELWWAGAITLIPILLIFLGAKSFIDIFIAVIGAYIYLLVILLLPVITSLFILKKIPED